MSEVNNLDARELPKAWPADLRQATEVCRGIRANPLLKCTVEALVIAKTTGSSTGFSEFVACEYVRRHLGDSGLELYRAKVREAAEECREYVELADGPGWKISPLTVGLTLAHDLGQLMSPAPHIRLISDALCDAAAGKGPSTVMTSLPSRFGKSETAGRRALAWFLANYPGYPCIFVSATDELATTMGRLVKNDLKLHEARFGFSLAEDSSASSRFNTSVEGGILIATGILGQIAGRGAAFMVIDDVFKNSEQANSPTYQSLVWESWMTTLQSRLQAGAVTSIVGTRWANADLIGKLLSGNNGEVQPISARVISLPALATTDNDELGRQVGDALPLGPVRVDGFGYSKEELEQRKASVSEEVWLTCYQQCPIDATVVGRAFQFTDDLVDDAALYDPSNSVIRVSFDFNVSPWSAVLFQATEFIPNRQRWLLTNERVVEITIFDELSINDCTTTGGCEAVIAKLKELPRTSFKRKIIVSGDASGVQRRTSSGNSQVAVSDWDIVGKAFRESGLDHRIIRFSKNESVRDKVNRTNSFLAPASGGGRRVRIHPRCAGLIKDLRSVRWLSDANGNRLPVLDKRTLDLGHLADALSYGLRAIEAGGYGERAGSLF